MDCMHAIAPQTNNCSASVPTLVCGVPGWPVLLPPHTSPPVPVAGAAAPNTSPKCQSGLQTNTRAVRAMPAALPACSTV